MTRCKAPEILSSEAYSDVRRNDEGPAGRQGESRAARDRWAFFSSLLISLLDLHEDLSMVEDTYSSRFLGNNNRQGVRQAGDPCGCPMAAPKT